MNIQEYLKNRLENCCKYELTNEDKKIIQFEGIEEFIFRKIKSKKYRKTSIDEDSEKQVRNAISIRVKNKLPIKFNYPFGAYKLWRIPSHPFVDWAEFFTIAYVSEYLAPVLAAYEYGIEFNFSCDDVIIEVIDNYPREELDKYSESFESLIKSFKEYFPTNYHMEMKHIVPDVYSKDEYEIELKGLYLQRKEAGYTDEQRDAMIKKMELHFRENGAKNYGELTERERMNIWEDLTYYSDAYLKLPKRRAFVRAEDAIVLFSNKIPNAIDIGSTKASKSKFWTGVGIVEDINGSFTEKILSPKQWELTNKNFDITEIDLFKDTNLKTIPVSKVRLDFLNKN